MSQRTRVLVLFAAAVLLAGGASHAQSAFAGNEAYLELLKSDIKQERVDIINRAMSFSAEDAAAFWPIYNEFQEEQSEMAKERIGMISEFARTGGSLTDEQAADLAGRWLDVQERRAALMKTYHGRVAEALSPVQAFKLVQLEHRLSLVVDMQIANELPMVE